MSVRVQIIALKLQDATTWWGAISARALLDTKAMARPTEMGATVVKDFL